MLIVTGKTGSRIRCGGFTLVELMIVIVVVAILVAIAYPSYESAMIKGRRSDAESTLMDIAQRQQQYLLDARAYAPDVATLNVTIPPGVSAFYTISISAPSTAVPPTFVASAVPIPGSAQGSDVTLTIDNTGAKSPSGVW